MSGSVLGIDLGTTNSVVASIDDSGTVVILLNAVGAATTPSAVFFEPNGEAVVGEEARQRHAVDNDNGVVLVKRAMGTEFPIIIGGVNHTPESISALILRQLASAVPDARPRVVITVPAYFGLAEREATQQAGKIAQLDVLQLLDEPVAAAIYYGLTRGEDRTVLVYDLGGGTFDATVLKIASGEAEVVATAGHSSLGGADVDERLLDLVLGRLESKVPAEDFEAFVEDANLLSDLLLSIEPVKRGLSSRTSQDVTIYLASDKFTIPLTRQDLETACMDLFESTAAIIDELLATAAKKGVAKVDEVIMVGGSSRIPFVADQLTSQLGVTPRLVEPDLAVAKGAALLAHQLVGSSQLASMVAASGKGASFASAGKVIPATPRGVGFLIEDSHDPSGERSFVAHVVEANSSLPVSKTVSGFGTIIEDQDAVRIQVYEQAGSVLSPEVGHNRRVLDGELTGLEALPAGSMIELTVDLAVDGRLKVIAREPRAGKELVLEAFIEGVIDDAESERLTEVVGMTRVRG